MKMDKEFKFIMCYIKKEDEPWTYFQGGIA